MKRVVYFLILNLFIYTQGIMAQTDEDESAKIQAFQDSIWNSMIGRTFPFDSLRLMSGQKFDFLSLSGKPTLINFWFTTCKPCVDEMPVLNEIFSRYSNKINFIAITYEPKADVERFLLKHSFTFTHISDAERYIDKLSFISFPVNVFLDKDRKVVAIKNGIPYVGDGSGNLKMGDGLELVEILETLLDKKD